VNWNKRSDSKELLILDKATFLTERFTQCYHITSKEYIIHFNAFISPFGA